MAQSSHLSSPTAQSTWMSRLGRARLPMWVALLVGAGLLAGIGWQRVAMNRAEVRQDTDRQAMARQFESDRQALVGDLRAKVGANTDEARRQFGMVLAWAVRGEMIRNNLDQVDQFFTELVKLPNTERVLLADSAGTVRVATDRRHLGAALTSLVSVEATLPDEVMVRATQEGGKVLVVPIMGLNSRLGTVVVSYREPDVLGGN